MEINKMTKAQIQEAFAKISQERDSYKLSAENAVKIANFYGANLESIEMFINQSPFVNAKGKWLKQVWWLITNIGKVKELIELIINQIKVWRATVDDLVRQAKEAAEAQVEQPKEA